MKRSATKKEKKEQKREKLYPIINKKHLACRFVNKVYNLNFNLLNFYKDL